MINEEQLLSFLDKLDVPTVLGELINKYSRRKCVLIYHNNNTINEKYFKIFGVINGPFRSI